LADVEADRHTQWTNGYGCIYWTRRNSKVCVTIRAVDWLVDDVSDIERLLNLVIKVAGQADHLISLNSFCEIIHDRTGYV